jgi:hypothetical protein
MQRACNGERCDGWTTLQQMEKVATKQRRPATDAAVSCSQHACGVRCAGGDGLHALPGEALARGGGGTGPRWGWHWPAAGMALARGGDGVLEAAAVSMPFQESGAHAQARAPASTPTPMLSLVCARVK